jgi:solute carrier family 8 (sodium/calcium exchanger)
MEKEGFVRSVNFIKNKELKIKEIVTDRHVQIVKYVREEMPNSIHHFDVWHVVKGIYYTQKSILMLIFPY